MIIKTGILCIPAYDEEAIAAVRQLLASEVRTLVVLQDQRSSMQRNLVEEVLRRWADEEELDLIVTIGGTLPAAAPGNQEIVPEATLAIAERLMPGLPEAMRRHAATRYPLAGLDRGVAVIRGRTLVLNLPAGAAVATTFLTPIVGLIAPITAHLQGDPTAPAIDRVGTQPAATDDAPGSDDAPETPAAGPRKKELDPAEFAAFLKRRSQGHP